MIATPIPAPQKIKEKKCISSWYIELEVLKVYSIVPRCYLGIYSRSLGNIQNYLTIPRRFWNFPGFFGSWNSECNNHCSSCQKEHQRDNKIPGTCSGTSVRISQRTWEGRTYRDTRHQRTSFPITVSSSLNSVWTRTFSGTWMKTSRVLWGCVSGCQLPYRSHQIPRVAKVEKQKATNTPKAELRVSPSGKLLPQRIVRVRSM